MNPFTVSANATAVGADERDGDEGERGRQEHLEGLAQSGFEVRGLNLGEVTELPDEDDDEGRRHLLPARRGIFDTGLTATLRLFGGLRHEEQIGRPAEKEHADDQVLPVHGEEGEQRAGAHGDTHLHDQRQ
jgi:hypothetical protein